MSASAQRLTVSLEALSTVPESANKKACIGNPMHARSDKPLRD